MSRTEDSILNLFKKHPTKTFSTTEIIENIDPKHNKIKEIIQNQYSSKDQIKKAKQLKAKLHRKILYYINKLIENDVLILEKQGNKGEKYVSLSIKDDEELIVRKYTKRKITISKPHMPASPIEGYEQIGIVHKFEAVNWISRLNSILIEVEKIKDLSKTYDLINNWFSNVNDAIGLNNFEYFIKKNDNKAINFLKKIDVDCKDYGKKLTLILDLSNITKKDYSSILKFIENYKKYTNSVHLIIDLTSKEINEHSELLDNAVSIYSKYASRIWIKNKDVHSAPYIIGRPGPYTFNNKEWEQYKHEYPEKLLGISCGQSTLSIDLAKFFSENKPRIKEFNEFLINNANTLLTGNSLQRRKSSEYFKNIIALNAPSEKGFFNFSRNYIRFWNYGWKQDNIDQELISDLLKTIKDKIDQFCLNEETIYMVCGMPMRFKIAFSCAFRGYHSQFFTQPKYKKLKIQSSEILYNKNIKEILKAKEKITNIFDGGDTMSFYRQPEDLDEITNELRIINSYKLPLISYKFEMPSKVNLKLDQFIK